MVGRCSGLASLGLLLVVTSGCPEPEDEAGDEASDDTGEIGETDGDGDGDGDGDTGDGDTGDGDGDGGPVRPRPHAEGGCDTSDGGDGDGDGDGDTGDTGDTGDGDGDEADPCWDDTWAGDVLPHVILGNTTDLADDLIGSCGIAAAPDFQLGFFAPWSGSFTFDTGDSSFDTVLYVQSGKCGEIELACNDDFIGLDSRVSVELEQGQVVTVSVDGTGPFEDGLFKLEISETVTPICDTQLITPNLPIVQGDTSDANNQLASGCGGDGAPEQVYEFVAPGPGTYHFDTFGSAFDTVLYTLDECDGPPLACNDDAGFDLQSELFVELAGGQKTLIVVDGLGPGDAGQFLLNVEKL